MKALISRNSTLP